MPIARYRFGEFSLDPGARELRRRGEVVALPARVFECLCCLIGNRERAVHRDELMRAVFGHDDVSDARLAQVILRCRRAIDDDGHEQRLIRTVPRFGFRWLGPVEVQYAEAAAGGAAHAADRPTDLPGPGKRQPRRWPRAGWLLACAAAALLGTADRPARGPSAAPADDRVAAARSLDPIVAVLPMRVDGPADASWARLGLMDFVADRLRRGGLPVLSSEAVLGMLQRDGAERDLRQASRVGWIVASRARFASGGWEVSLTGTDDAGILQHGQGRHAELLAAATLAADRLLAALGGHAPAGGDPPALAERLQRARAAMLANEIETARRILAEAPELQRSLPHFGYQMAQVDFRAGDFRRGLDTLDAALDSDAAARDPLFKARLLNARGAMLFRLDRLREAGRAYDEAVALAERNGHAAELGIALSGRAVVHSMQGRPDQALADFGRARVQLESVGNALAVARVDANLGILEVDRHRPAHALPYLQAAAADFRSLGAVNELARVRKMLMVAHMQVLRTDEALAESERALAMLDRVEDPEQRADLVLTSAEVLIASGRLSRAAGLLARADAAAGADADYGRRDYLRVELAMRNGQTRQAAGLAAAALRDWPPRRNPRLRAWMQLRLLLAMQDAESVEPAVFADAIQAADDSLPGRLLQATLQRMRGDVAAADDGFRAALALAERDGVPEQIAAVVGIHAPWLLARGRLADAAALAGRTAPWAAYDFDLALLQVRLLRALGQKGQWRVALDHAERLAGERGIPAQLAPEAPASGGER